MTEAEAKKIVERDLDIMIQNKALPDGIEAVKVLLRCLEDLEYLRQKHDITMKLLGKYREIGTVDELITLKRKSIAVKPIRNHNINWDYEEVKCPNCGNMLFSENMSTGYCHCGQKIYKEKENDNR